MVEHNDERFEADLDVLRDLARDCRSSGKDIKATIEKAPPAVTRMAGSGGMAEQFWQVCEQGRQRHLDLLRSAADALSGGAKALDAAADLLAQTDEASSHAINSPAAERPPQE